MITYTASPPRSFLTFASGAAKPLRVAPLRAAYHQALREGYLWHEFGDVCLIAPRLG